MAALLILASLYFLLMVETTAHSSGLEVSLDRTVPQREEGKPCSEFMCLVHGNSATINTVTISKVKVNGDVSEVLAVSASDPEINIKDEDIRANGALQGNSAAIYIELSDPSSCVSDFIACEVTFTNRSGHSGESFITAGPGKLPSNHAVPMIDRERRETVNGVEASPRPSRNQYLSELKMLRDKISVETDLSSRISRLEDRVSSKFLSESSETSSDVAQSLHNIVSRLEDVTANLEHMNASKVPSPYGGLQDAQPEICERGMLSPRYAITTEKSIRRQVLCDTHEDGGGWIVIQRRAVNDVHFYRDWVTYREGFGSLTGDFWLGNEAIQILTNTDAYELRIDFRINGVEYFAKYSVFRIGDESDQYRLRLGSYSGTIGEANSNSGLTFSNNQQFSTFDRDNDRSSAHCAISQHGAWWYGNSFCHRSNLNGNMSVKSRLGLSWCDGRSWKYPDYTEMKVRKIRPSTSP